MDYLQQQQQQQQQQSMMIAPHAQPAYVQQQMLAMMNLEYVALSLFFSFLISASQLRWKRKPPNKVEGPECVARIHFAL